MTPFVNDADFTLYVGDVRDCLRELPEGSVHTVVTSPPYWGLRDYGTGSWEGGDPDCEHTGVARRCDTPGRNDKQSTQKGSSSDRVSNTCLNCGATRVDQQLGLEPTPEAFVAAMVDVFREVRRVLRDDGTLWLNLGDSYAASRSGPVGDYSTLGSRVHRERVAAARHGNRSNTRETFPEMGIKTKDLVGIPWRVAFALQADGWYLRSDIIWSKPNPMPESVTDRPTKAHEYLFLLSKSPRYFFDQEAVREPHSPDGRSVSTRTVGNGSHGNYQEFGHEAGRERWPNGGRNIRSVWEIATQPYPEAHFATFPEALPDRCIRAGTSERGCCPECGAPWERIATKTTDGREFERGQTRGASGKAGRVRGGTDDSDSTWSHRTINGTTPSYRPPSVTTTGWEPSCDCDEGEDRLDGRRGGGDPSGLRGGDGGERRGGVIDRGQVCVRGADSEGAAYARSARRERLAPIPCTVLDPFMGSGTTALVARRLGRRSIGIELNEEYAQLCARRLQQLSLFSEGAA